MSFVTGGEKSHFGAPELLAEIMDEFLSVSSRAASSTQKLQPHSFPGLKYIQRDNIGVLINVITIFLCNVLLAKAQIPASAEI